MITPKGWLVNIFNAFGGIKSLDNKLQVIYNEGG